MFVEKNERTEFMVLDFTISQFAWKKIWGIPSGPGDLRGFGPNTAFFISSSEKGLERVLIYEVERFVRLAKIGSEMEIGLPAWFVEKRSLKWLKKKNFSSSWLSIQFPCSFFIVLISFLAPLVFTLLKKKAVELSPNASHFDFDLCFQNSHFMSKSWFKSCENLRLAYATERSCTPSWALVIWSLISLQFIFSSFLWARHQPLARKRKFPSLLWSLKGSEPGVLLVQIEWIVRWISFIYKHQLSSL